MNAPTHTTRILSIPVNRLHVDPDAQRDLDEKRVEKYARNWSDSLCGALNVATDEADPQDATDFNVYDGQHRWAAGVLAGKDRLPCVVTYGVSRREQAELFLLNNSQRRAVDKHHLYRVALTAEWQWAVEIEETLTTLGLQVGRWGSRTTIRAVDGIRRIHSMGGQDLLARTLLVLRRAFSFPDDGEKWERFLLLGVARLIHDNPNIDTDRLVATLSSARPIDWKVSATTLAKGKIGGNKDIHVAQAVADQYNRRLSARNRVSVKR